MGTCAADPALLETLHPDKLLPSSNAVPNRFEQGTAPFELLAGVAAAVDYLAGLVPGAGTRRQRVLRSMSAIERYERTQFARLLEGLDAVEGVTTYGAAPVRTPTIGLRLAGWTPREVTEALGGRGICAWDGDYYAFELMRTLGLADTGGAVRIGLSHYNTAAEVDRLLAELGTLARRAAPRLA